MDDSLFIGHRDRQQRKLGLNEPSSEPLNEQVTHARDPLCDERQPRHAQSDLPEHLNLGGPPRMQALARYHRRLRHMLSELVLTEQRERRRIAGELHDHLAQLLVACKMKLTMLQGQVTPKPSPAPATQASEAEAALDPTTLLAEIDGFLNESLTYTRSLVGQISPVLLYEQGLLPALRWLAESVTPRHGLQVTIDEQTDLAHAQLEEDVRILLFQSVRELLFNALAHAHSNEATLTVRERDRGLEVTVADEGIGFDPARIDAGPADSLYGFGLMSIRECMALMGGQFELTSSPGRGTCATLWVPLQEIADEAAPVALPQPPAVARPPLAAVAARNHLHVLVVDDHAVVREGLMMMLGKEEDLVIVGEADDGPAALEAAHRLHPHVVLMDVGLPGMDGIETTRQLTAAIEGIKVVGLSMYEDESIATAMRAAGAVDYLCKGCSPDLLIDTIRRAACGKGDKPRTVAAP